MPCTARFPAYKIDGFLKNFSHFSEMRRLGYLKPPLCKGSRSELFPNQFPYTGTETFSVRVHFAEKMVSFQTNSPTRGRKPWTPDPSSLVMTFQTNSPTRGRKQLLALLLGGWSRLSKPIPLHGDGNSMRCCAYSAESCLSKPIPLHGDGNV